MYLALNQNAFDFCNCALFFVSNALFSFFFSCDRQGRFLCGGINLENVDAPADVWKPLASVFRVEQGKGVRRILADEVMGWGEHSTPFCFVT